MFVTFYSFKGGVGRTLAVANVAYLLATHDEWPCRVLVWDFDLEAPGLQQVFKCKWRGERVGFVDYVYEYVTKAQIPDIEQHIHPTDVEGVDILPAGNLTKAYSQKLEAIDWREVYDRRRGYDLMNAVRTAIAEVRTDRGQPKYDYVLIDARTGYSDVGGICVQQLPDAVVLMFRLNDQNIRGTAEVYRAIQSLGAEPEGRHIDVVPVISPAWPFGAIEAAKYVKRAEKALDGRTALAITFEGALSYGETIITRDRDRYPTGLRICDDYARLTQEIRGLNDEDPLTIDREVYLTEDEESLTWGVLKGLVRRHPSNMDLWDELVGLYGESRPDSDVGGRLSTFLDGWIEDNPEHVPALVTRARLYNFSADVCAPDVAFDDYARAIRLAPDDASLRLERAQALADEGLYDEALAETERVLELDPDSPEAGSLRQRCLEAIARDE